MASKIATTTRRLFRIQYVSDIHLEFYDKVPFPLLVKPNARYLALAGDIGQPSHSNYNAFFQYVSSNWDKVFYVPGNHEYYSKHPAKKWKWVKPQTMEERDADIRSVVCQYSNVHLLSPESPSIYLYKENVAIVGSTLWTHIPSELNGIIRNQVNDFNYITKDGTMPIEESDVNLLHKQHYESLETAINYWAYQKVPVCVITHHMPSYVLISSKYAGKTQNCCFASNCEKIMLPHVKAWIYGHTHAASTGMVRKVFTAVNSRGYPDESVPGFSPEAFTEFDTSQSIETEVADKPLEEMSKFASLPEDIEFM
jgi:predicted phosphodiesterase